MVREYESTHNLPGLCNGVMGGLELNADQIGYLTYEYDDEDDGASGIWCYFESREDAEESLNQERNRWRIVVHIPACRPRPLGSNEE